MPYFDGFWARNNISEHFEQHFEPEQGRGRKQCAKLIDYAAGCSWHGSGFLAEDMKSNHFQDWKRVIVATEPCPET